MTGERVLLAKYYPTTGWYVSNSPLIVEELNALFHKMDFGAMTYHHAEAEGVKSSGGMFGRTDFEIEYEETKC